MHEEDKAILKSLVSVAWADGRVTSEETDIIEAILQAFEASPEDAAEMRTYAKTRRTLADIPLTDLSADDRRLLVQHAVLLTFIDGAQSPEEKTLLGHREALGPHVSLRVDANQGWDRSTALKAARSLEEWQVDFVEQPVPRWDLDGMAELGRQVSVPIMADESCFSPHDALAIARRGGVSILGLKVTKSAGLLGTMAIARIAEAAGMTCYVGCMIETSLGTAAYLHVALAAAPVAWGCELFGPLLLDGDVVRDPVRYADGCILGLDAPGLGVEIDETALKKWSRRP